MSVQNYQCRKCVARFNSEDTDCSGDGEEVKCPRCGSMEIDILSSEILDAVCKMPSYESG